jgi:hypothetical protein
MHQNTAVDNMTKKVTYICDVCNTESERPFKLHMVANIGSKTGPDSTMYADCCCEKCAIKFAKDASVKAGLSPGETTPVTVAS